MKLYDMTLSGNAYKARLFLALNSIEHELVPVSLADGENRAADYLALNPRGQVPVLVDGDAVIWDSQAILWHLATQPAANHWLPADAAGQVAVLQWLAVAGNECLFGLARARAVKLFQRPFDLETCQQYGRGGLAVLEGRLAANDWLATDKPSIADIACYPYVALAEEGEIALAPYPGLLAWMGRIQALEHYITMPGIRVVAAH